MEYINPALPLVPRFISRLKNEYEAMFFYRNAANYCMNVGYDLAGAYFEEEAKSEADHAVKLQAFLNDWGIDFALPDVSVSETFKGLPNVIYKAYEIEAALYQAYSKDAKEAFAVDLSAFAIFTEMVNIQYTSVAGYRTFCDKLKLINEANKFEVFMYEKEVFGQ